MEEVIWKIDGVDVCGKRPAYLKIHRGDESWSYSIYTDDCRLYDGGEIDSPDMSVEEVRDDILSGYGWKGCGCVQLNDDDAASVEEAIEGAEEEESFLFYFEHYDNSFIILQMRMKENQENIRYCFTDMEQLEEWGEKPERRRYRAFYSGELKNAEVKDEYILGEIFHIFNLERPSDFYGHSLSVSDVVGIRRKGFVEWYFCDSVGWRKLEGFA